MPTTPAPTATLEVEHAKAAPAGSPAVAVPVAADAVDAVDPTTGVDGAFLAARGWKGNPGDVVALPGPDGQVVLAVGVGPADEVGPAVLRRAAAAVAGAAARHEEVVVHLLDALPEGADRPAAARAVAEGLALGAYRFTVYRSSPEPVALSRAVVVGPGGEKVRSAVDRGRALAGATNLARDLVNTPGGDLTPRAFADRIAEVAAEAGVEAEVWDEKRIKRERLGGLLAVNRGSSEPARFVVLRHRPERARASVALVGKGITFDSGGLSIKTADGMVGMKGDMGGAAAVVGAMSVAPALAPRVAATAYLPITDNMLGGDAQRVGDVFTARDGTTVEVLNTDAEGRLILADALCLAVEDGHDAIVDLATLTGACMVALGAKVAGLMGNDEALVEQVAAAAEAAGERVWHLPLPGDYRRLLDSSIADIKNIGNRYGGALTAGLFLQEFVPDGTPWAHLDIAGPAYAEAADGEHPKGGTGFGVRLLAELLSTYKRPGRSR